MNNTLDGITNLYVDSNILIYLIEGNAELGKLVLEAFRDIEARNITLHTSEITITECLNGAYRAGLEKLAKHYLELLATEDFITLFPVSTDVCIEAARLGAAHRLKTVDALHLATATLSGCQALLSNDSGFRSTKDVRTIQLSVFKHT